MSSIVAPAAARPAQCDSHCGRVHPVLMGAHAAPPPARRRGPRAAVGSPGTHASTGTTSWAPGRTLYESQYGPPVAAQAPKARTARGSGSSANASASAGARRVVTVPATTRTWRSAGRRPVRGRRRHPPRPPAASAARRASRTSIPQQASPSSTTCRDTRWSPTRTQRRCTAPTTTGPRLGPRAVPRRRPGSQTGHATPRPGDAAHAIMGQNGGSKATLSSSESPGDAKGTDREQAGCSAGEGHHPLRRRLRGRHAAHRRPVHPRDGVLRQRPVHAAGLPRRDPRPSRHGPRGQRLPAAVRRPRDPDPGRRRRRPDRDEPRGPEEQPAPRPPRWAPDHQQRRVHQARRREGRLRLRPAQRRQPRVLRRAPREPDHPDGRGAQGLRHHQEGGRAGEEHVRPGPAQLAVLARDRGDPGLPARPSSAASPRSWPPTSPRSTPAGRTARPPRTSPSTTRSAPRSCRPGCTATSPATPPCPTG